MSIAKDLHTFMKSYFGDLAGAFVSRELDALRLNNVTYLTDEQKLQFTQRLIQSCFDSICSPQKCVVLRSRLLYILKVSKQTRDKMNRQWETAYKTS